ncbi:hypothetical protein CROQUDRAFT_67538 [Cronartium quercuum f. sp. fusiforme G11]|uniref:Dolichyl-diphosphooligosaccharide--protein glycosyltransferase subunit WBP1 n=1 Tax=Cronartium quercuum f. sp. fusiforme G11 TaxID=708437 RepID=A0A9P6NA65_9BASI|nr:hypothetical protein CROQUDRAFT_67538 [Cronartium quercuum f. sp. fusiforme G11]
MKMISSLLCFILLHLHLQLISADKVLIITEDTFNQADYSQFWSSIQSQGHDLSFRSSKESSPQLYEHEQISFQHLIIFAPTTKSFAEDLSPQKLVQFLEDGGNIILGLSTKLSEYWRDFGREFDLDFDDKSTSVIDHFSNIENDPTKIITSLKRTPLIEDQTIISDRNSKVVFRGIGHGVGKNPLIINILRSSPLSYSHEISLKDQVDNEPFITGDEIGLITGFQTRHSSRIIFIGSIEFFSNDFFDTDIVLDDGTKAKAANAKVSQDLIAWAFKQTGVLRIISSTHSKVNGLIPKPERYKINDEIEYKVDIQTLKNGEWGPSELKDLQIEFTMLDPHLRKTLSPISIQKNYTTYSTVFRIPDRHGVFTFKLDYRRRNGISNLFNTLQVMVTPPEHDQHPRFLVDAYPYYLGTTNVLLAFVIFCVIWLTHLPGGGKKSQ